jgi:hypothetical protein
MTRLRDLQLDDQAPVPAIAIENVVTSLRYVQKYVTRLRALLVAPDAVVYRLRK